MTDLIATYPIRLTSREIAELVEKRHDNVKRTIETLVSKGVINQPQIEFLEEISNLGLPIKREVYVFGLERKRDTFVVVAQLSPEFTARLVDRWQELEAQVANPSTFPEKYHPLLIARLAVEAATAFGFRGNQAVLSANNAIRNLTGTNLLGIMETPLIAPDQEGLLTPSDIGLRTSQNAREVNRRLIMVGLQTAQRDHKDRLYYDLTPLGHTFGVYLDTGKRRSNATPVRQLKWRTSVIDLLTKAERESDKGYDYD